MRQWADEPIKDWMFLKGYNYLQCLPGFSNGIFEIWGVGGLYDDPELLWVIVFWRQVCTLRERYEFVVLLSSLMKAIFSFLFQKCLVVHPHSRSATVFILSTAAANTVSGSEFHRTQLSNADPFTTGLKLGLHRKFTWIHICDYVTLLKFEHLLGSSCLLPIRFELNSVKLKMCSVLFYFFKLNGSFSAISSGIIVNSTEQWLPRNMTQKCFFFFCLNLFIKPI